MKSNGQTNTVRSKGGRGRQPPHPVDVFDGRQLSEGRVFQGIGREEMARRLNITPRRLERYELGLVPVPVEILALAGAALGVAVESLFPRAEALTAQAPDSPMSDDEVRKLAGYFDNCPTDVRQRLLAAARATASQSQTEIPEC